MKTYNLTIDEFTKELILTALMEMAHRKGISIEAKNNYLTAYFDIKKGLVPNDYEDQDYWDALDNVGGDWQG